MITDLDPTSVTGTSSEAAEKATIMPPIPCSNR